MKKLFLLLLLAIALDATAQIAINTDGTTPDNSAMLDVKSTTKGLLVPRMTLVQRNALTSPATSLIIYQTDNTPGYYYNSGTNASPLWKLVGDGGLILPYTGSVTQSSGFAFSLTSNGSTCIKGEGIVGLLGYTNATDGWGNGVSGSASQTTGTYYGVHGTSNSTSGVGVYGLAYQNSGVTKGVYGETRSPSGYGVHGLSTTSGGFAGYFDGGKFYVEKSMGIGTTAPDCQLTVKAPSTGSMDLVNFKNTTDNYLFRFRQSSNGSGGLYLYDGSANNTIFLYGDGNSFINSGRVGIGTTSPGAFLAVSANSSISVPQLQLYEEETEFSRLMFKNASSSSYQWTIAAAPATADDAARMHFYYNGTTGGNNLVSITGDGKVGIGTETPTKELDVDGNARFRDIGMGVAPYYALYEYADGVLCSSGSDIRLKENIQPLQNSLDKVMKLNGVSFTWKADPNKTRCIGFIAQEFEKVIPELVFTHKKDDYKGINYPEITAILADAIKELKRENDQLKAENENMNARLVKIETVLNYRTEK